MAALSRYPPTMIVDYAPAPLRGIYGRRMARDRAAARRGRSPAPKLMGRRPAGPASFIKRYAPKAYREMPIYAPPYVAQKHEMHYLDEASASYVADTTGSVTLINDVALNDLVQAGRSGNRIMMYGTMIRGVLLAGTTGTVARAVCCLVYDRLAKGTAPVIGDIFQTISPDSFVKAENHSRFLVLGRWVYTVIGNSTTPTVGREEVNIDLKVLYKQQTVFDDGTTTGVIANIISGSLWLVTFGDMAAGTTAPNFTLQCRTWFSD